LNGYRTLRRVVSGQAEALTILIEKKIPHNFAARCSGYPLDGDAGVRAATDIESAADNGEGVGGTEKVRAGGFGAGVGRNRGDSALVRAGQRSADVRQMG